MMMTEIKAYVEQDGRAALMTVRHQTPDEAAKYIAEMRDTALLATGTENIEITKPYRAEVKVITDMIWERPTLGWLPGGNSTVWAVSDEEHDALAAIATPVAPAPKPAAPVSDEVRAYQARYGNSDAAWEAGDEEAWAKLHAAGR